MLLFWLGDKEIALTDEFDNSCLFNYNVYLFPYRLPHYSQTQSDNDLSFLTPYCGFLGAKRSIWYAVRRKGDIQSLTAIHMCLT